CYGVCLAFPRPQLSSSAGASSFGALPAGLSRLPCFRLSCHSALGHNAPDGPGHHANHEGEQAKSCGAVSTTLLWCHDHAYFTTGGVSKVWKGAGEGTDHSRPVAPSHGWAGAGSPILRDALMTSQRKISCDKPNQNAPMVAIMLKSVNCDA